MKGIVLILSLFLCSPAWATIDWNDKQIEWHGYADGLAKMKRENKNALLVVYSEYCGTCKKYALMFKDPGVVREAKKVVLIRIDRSVSKKDASRFRIDGHYVPRTFMLSSDGRILPSPYKSPKYTFYLPPNNAGYLVKLLKYLGRMR